MAVSSRSLHGSVVVITGASSGFGRGAALAFAGEGASVVLVARRDEVLDEVAAECEALGSRALVAPADVGYEDDVEQVGYDAIERFGRIDVWINNAGVGAIGRFDEVPLADHRRVIETDLLGVIYGSHVALRQFRRQGFGTLINVASALGKVPAPYYGSYTAAKYGVVGLSGVLRQELSVNKDENIHVCTVMPMAHDTPWFERAANYTGHAATPIPPLYDPQDVVETLVRLAKEPEAEVVVGAAGHPMIFAHGVMPRPVEAMMARQTHQAQIKKAEPAADTSGGIHEPIPEGVDVYGGRLEEQQLESGSSPA